MMQRIHKFDESHFLSELPDEFVDSFYQSAFPDMVRHEYITDIERQKAGVDRIVYLASGDVVHIDEKVRYKYRPDFLLEVGHTNNMIGGMQKELDIDYMAYIWKESRDGYLLHWGDLFKQYHLNEQRWIQAYGIKRAENVSYDTLSVAVPKHIVLNLVRHIYAEGYIAPLEMPFPEEPMSFLTTEFAKEALANRTLRKDQVERYELVASGMSYAEAVRHLSKKKKRETVEPFDLDGISESIYPDVAEYVRHAVRWYNEQQKATPVTLTERAAQTGTET